jgi:hypothetical protein
VVGDSIAFNSPDDCHGCTGFVDRYAEAITKATGHPVEVQNLSQHNGLQIDGLLQELKTDTLRRDALANADIIIVGIAHNDTAMNSNEDVCDGPNGDIPDWSKYNAECAAASAELFRPKFESVYSQIAALREGKPTIFRTINRYNDWIGWPGHDLPPEASEATRLAIAAWNEMLCSAAEKNGFVCADLSQAFNGPDGLKPSGSLLASDYTHPSDSGNEVITHVLTDLGFAPLVSTAASENEVWSEGLPPNGSWTVNLTLEDVIGKGVSKSKAPDWTGTYTWIFQDGKAKLDFQGPSGPFSCQADLASVGDTVKFTYTSGSECVTEVDDVQWRLGEDGLHLHLVAIKNAPFVENKAVYEAKTWQKVPDQ